jgi:hypothetical protein
LKQTDLFRNKPKKREKNGGKSSKIKNLVHKAVKLKIEKCILKCEVTKAGNKQL